MSTAGVPHRTTAEAAVTEAAAEHTAGEALPLTAAQLGIWHAQRLEPDSPYYLVGDVVEISGPDPVDADALAEAIRATTDEAESLRLRVVDTPDGPRQFVGAEPAVRPEIVDVRGEPDPTAAAERIVTAERARAAEHCRTMVDRTLYTRTVIRLSDREVWYTQLGHHLVFDGYSAAMLARRTGVHYTALVRGEHPPPSPFGRFADVVAADREYRDSERAVRDREYWRQRLTPVPETGAADGAGAGPPGQTRTARAVLDPGETARLRAFAEQEGTTWGEALLACYAAFVHRTTGRADVVFALPLMCRTSSAELRTPAMVVNVLPVRIAVRGGDRLGELSRRTAAILTEMRAHQRYRGEDLPRDLGSPEAGALLHGRGVNLKAFDLAVDFAGATGVLRNVAGGPPEDDALSVLPTRDGGLLLGFEVDARTHTQADVEHKLAVLRRMLSALIADDRPALGRVRLLDPAHERRVLADRSAPAPPRADTGVPDALDALAAADPAATALVCGPERLSRADLAEGVHRLARALRARGVGPEDVVALSLPRSPEFVVALLAVLDAGAAFLPLDTAHPAGRLRALLADARPALVLTTAATDPLGDTAGTAEGDGGAVPARLRLDDPAVRAELARTAGGPLTPDELAAPRHPEHLAYVIYTSGSTGHPKGVLGRRGGLTAWWRHHRATLVADAERAAGRRLRAAHTYSVAFDSSLDQLLWLLCGHELHLYDAETARDAEALREAYARDRIDVVDTTPSMAAPLVDAGLLAAGHRPSLLILGGEATPAPLWRRVAASGIPARNLYGPTEATVDSTMAHLDDGEPTIGHPLGGTRVHVLDGALHPVPHGTPGELYLAGPHLARGYAGAPGQTAERFVADPYADHPGARMYRTGDLARWVPGRGLEYLGRADGQVTVRGHRVEIGEVEAALAAVPGVAAAAATVRTDAGPARLVGYVVPGAAGAGPDPAPTPESVRAALAERVPAHLVPAVVVPLDELPRTANGKLDRAALPAPRTGGGGRAPRTAPERALCAAVAEILADGPVGADDDFVALGGDSITAIGVSSRLRAHGLSLRPRDLLARRTLAELAADAASAGPATPGAAAADGAPAPADEPVGPLPAPPIVRALLDRNPDVTAIAGYAQWTVVSVPREIAVDDLVGAVAAVLDRHDALRAVLTPGAEDEVHVRPPGAVPAADVVHEVPHGGSVPGAAEAGDDGAIGDRAATGGGTAALAERLAATLDPCSGDLLRVALVRTGAPTADSLVVVAHHLVVDGVSWRVLLPDLHAAWDAVRRGRPADLAPVGTSWRTHARLLAGQGRDGARHAELDHWRRAAASGAAPLGPRGLDRARDTVDTAEIRVTTADPEVTEAVLTTLPSAYRTGADAVLLTALVLAVRRYRRERDLPADDVVGVTLEGHGRDGLAEVDLSRTVGWCTAEYPVAAPAGAVRRAPDLADALAGGDTVGRLVCAVKEALRAVPDGGVGYGVLRHLDPDVRDDLAALPEPEIVLNYLGRFAASPGAGWRLPDDDPFAVVEPAAKALDQVLALNCFVHEGEARRLSVEWTAAGRVLDTDTTAALRRAWQAALAALAAHARSTGPDGGVLTPSDVPLVSLDQRGLDALQRDRRLADVLPATALQAGLSFHSLVRAEHDPDLYVVQAVTTLRGAVDADRMAAAVRELLRRHPQLRLYLAVLPEGNVVQAVPADVTVDWRVADVSGHPPAARAGAVEARTRAELERPFDPGTPPLIRFLLCTLAPDDHRLVITNHHALLDGWSMPLVGRMLLALYTELGGGPAAPDPVPLTGYHHWLAARDRQKSLRTWADELSGVDEGTHLAPAHAEGRVTRPERVSVELGAEFSGRLREFARHRGTTLTTVLQTAWGLLLGRVTGRRDVLFGCPVSGRPPEVDGVESMIGQLGTTIPVRVSHAPHETVAQVLGDVHSRSLALAEHHHVGLPDIQRAAGVGELFDTMLVMENFPAADRRGRPGGAGAGPELAGVDITDATHYPLTLVVLPGEEILLGLGYQPHVFAADTVRAYGRWLHTLLRAMVDDPARPVARLPLLDEAERAAMLRLGTGPAPVRERDGCLTGFGRWVARQPDAEAVVCRDRALSYAELDRLANRLAHALRARGVRPQDPVAVLLDRDVEMVVALLGVFKAGAVYVPLDAGHPPARLAFLLDDAAPAATVTTSALLPVLDAADDPDADDPDASPAGRGRPALLLDDPERPVAADSGPGPGPVGTAPGPGPADDRDPVEARRGLTPDSLAYVLYTSGTTGRPKGVAVPHRGLADLVALQEDVVGVSSDVRYLHFASTAFDVAVWQTLLPLLSGGTCVIAPEEVRVPGPELFDYVARHRVTGLNLLPSFLAAVPDDCTVDDDVFLMVGAERLDAELVRRWGTGRTLFNAYGPTEVTVNAVTWRRGDGDGDRAEQDPEWTPPIGRPDPNVRAYVLDDGLQPVGTGVVGQLYLAGPKLARGYLGRPALTAAAFVADPFGPPGTRMYRTGDLVHWRADGQLVFHGRADDQVKIRGFRVELGEIEAVLGRHPDVRACAVVVREDRPGRPRLVGYVIPADGAAPDPARLRADLARTVPDHLVPAALVVLDRLPLGPSGKLDRTALPAPEEPRGETPTRAPATHAEAVLLRVVRSLLGTDAAGPDDDFLDLGGDSIVSLQLVSRARREGLRLAPRDVFEGGTIAGIAARATPLDAASGTSAADEGSAVGDAPLTPVMRELLRRCAAGGSTARGFCQWIELTVPPGGDTAEWEAVLDALLARHDVLRARLALPAGADGADTTGTGTGTDTDSGDAATDPVLRIPPEGTVTGADVLVTVRAGADDDLRTLLDAERDRARDALDPWSAPLVRAVWVDAGPHTPGRLALVAHHLVVDGVSWRVLVDDLEHAHTRLVADDDGRPVVPALPRHGRSFRDWARTLSAAAPDRRTELPYWRRVRAAPARPLSPEPLDPARDTAATARHHTITLDPDTTRAVVTTLPTAYRTTADTVLLTALALAVAEWRDEPDLLVALESHGRPTRTPDGAEPVDLSQTVGWFTTVHPARIVLPAAGRDAALPEALKAVKEHRNACADGLGHGLLAEAPDRPLDDLPIPEISWNYLGRLPGTPEDGRLWARPADAEALGSGGGAALPLAHPLMINALVTDEGDGPALGVRITRPEALFSEEDVAGLAEALRGALTRLARDPDVVARAGLTPSDLPLVSLDQTTLDRLEAGHAVRDVLPLTPMQELMLRHSRTARAAAGPAADPYTTQSTFWVHGALDVDAVHAAAADLLARHPNLGAVFPSDPGADGMQVLPTRPRPDSRVVDLGPVGDGTHAQAIERVLADDLAEGVDPATGPTLRVTVLRCGPDRAGLVLTTHHALSDGWSAPRMLTELFTLYADRVAGREPGSGLPAPVPFARLLHWRAARDTAADLRAWHTELDGLPDGRYVAEAPSGPGAAHPFPDPVLTVVDADVVAGLDRVAARRGLTRNTLVQGAWATVLAARSGRRDVCFGAMVSARTPEVDGIEEILGLVANTVPVRVRLTGTGAWMLADLQTRRQALAEYQHVGLADLERIAGRSPLFDSLLVFENYPVDADRLREPAPGLRVTGTRFRERTHHPLTLTVLPEGDRWRVVLSHRADLLTADDVRGLADDLRWVLGRMAADAPGGRHAGVLDSGADDLVTALRGGHGG